MIRLKDMILFIPGLVMAALMVAPQGSTAYTRADLEKVRTTHSCVGCNLRGAALVGFDLTGADLTGSDLTGANLAQANLAGANLSGARMVDVRLPEADLTGADFSGAVWIDGAVCKAGSIGKCVK